MTQIECGFESIREKLYKIEFKIKQKAVPLRHQLKQL